jgi:hypothetical protein
MPVVARVDGVKINLYLDDHPPPHFHAEFGEFRAQILIDGLAILNGYIPSVQYRKVVAWARPRRELLLAAWMRCREDLHPGRIA